jgi:hypothetical protein
MSTVPYIFANAVGNISLAELDVNFANVKAYANTAGEVLNADQHNITSVGTLTSLSVTGMVVAGNVFTDGQVSAGNTVTGGNFFTESDVTALGNVIAGNLVAPTAVVNLIKSDDSTVVGVDDGLEIYGSLVVNSNVNAQDVIAANIIGGNVLTSTIRSDDSTVVNIDDGLEVHGPTRVNATVYADDFVSNGNIAMTSAVKRVVWVSSSAPSSGDGADGDIWFQVP